jgi:alginate O-acetyltransferase complex protein AlgI
MTGLWHGASWNFVLWGLYFAFFLILEKLILLPLLKKAPVFAHLYTLMVCVVSFVIFETTDMGQIITMLKGMFGFGGLAFSGTMTGYVWASFWRLLVIAVIGATSLPKILWNRLAALCKGGISQNVIMVVEGVGLLALFLSCTAFLVSGSFNPFLYFRF